MAVDLDLVVGFLNTLDVEGGTDDFGDPAAAARWFASHGLLPPGAAVDERALHRARALRSALRQLAHAHHDQHEPDAAAAAFTAVAGTLPLRAVADAGGAVHLEGAAGGVEAAMARVVAAVAQASALGTWPRVKVCPADDCQWAFVDASKNRSRRWCAMGVCGNRQKTRAYRQRQSARAG